MTVTATVQQKLQAVERVIKGGEEMETLRDKMIAWRAKNGVTLEELAQRCGLTYVTVQRIESGKGHPTRTTVAKILAVINKKK